MTRTTATALTTTLGVATASWAVAVHQMAGMDMGSATELGSLTFFAGAWVSMMAAMMLPGAAPAVLRHARADARPVAAPAFAASYLAVWAVVGLAVYALYRPHGSVAAGALTVAAGVYELTPLKRECRHRCRESVRSGLEFGFFCLGSSIGLMVLLLALGAMSVAWMALVAVIVIGQKLVAPTPWIDVPVAIAIVALGIGAALAPTT
jgi:predicted metal-binding membrane protein